MKSKRYICESCGCGSDQTHMHHILPKSKGGTDLPSNLIEVCPPCHRKIHDTNFSGDSGLIKNGIKKTRQENKEAAAFMETNSESLVKFCDDFFEEYGTEVLHEMMRFGVLPASDFVRILKGEDTRKSYGDVTDFIYQLYISAPNKYSFVF